MTQTDVSIGAKELWALQQHFVSEFPSDPPLIMPAKLDGKGKMPKYMHKEPGQYSLDDARMHLGECLETGALVLLPASVIVVDIDDDGIAETIMGAQDEFRQTVTCKTSKGWHFWFKRTAAADGAGMRDGARAMRDEAGQPFPIDIKTLCATGTRGVISIPPSPRKTWVRSPLDPHVRMLDLPQAFVDLYIHATGQKRGDASSRDARRRCPLWTHLVDSVQFQEIKQLMTLLPASFKNSYGDWFRLLTTLHNADDSEAMMSLFIEFSRDSVHWQPSSSEDYIKEKWNSLRPLLTANGATDRRTLTIGSLHYWAKLHNPERYKQVLGQRLSNDISHMTAEHNDVARVASRILKGRFVCACPSQKIWYAFRDHRWTEDAKQIHLKHELSTTVVDALQGALVQLQLQFASSNRRIFMLASDADDAATVASDAESMASASDCALTSVSRNSASRAPSSSRPRSPIDDIAQTIQSIRNKLKRRNYKDDIVVELMEYMTDEKIEDKFDMNPSLIGFEDGVYDLDTKTFREGWATDYVSKSTGYPYNDGMRPPADTVDIVNQYWSTLHPDFEQREYVLRMFARQLYADSGRELLHIHTGERGSAGNGKTKMFQLLQRVLGQYVHKFPISVLTSANRDEANKPQPEFHKWRGVRILYATEPNHDEKINTGIMKDLTGGELIQYRLLYSNDVRQFKPTGKLHVMTNDLPNLDGSDSGVKRRIRKIDYISSFVSAADADPSQHKYAANESLFERLVYDMDLKQAFVKHLLDYYDKSWSFAMTEKILKESSSYLKEHDSAAKFVEEFVVRDPSSCFTLKDAKALFKQQEYYNGRIKMLKTDLEKTLKTVCLDQKRVRGYAQPFRNVFEGYRLLTEQEADDNDALVIDLESL